MKIGIITLWDSEDNYGQILQSFSLLNFLKENGHNAYVIRYNIPNDVGSKQKLWKIIIKLLLIKPYLSQKKKKQERERKEKRRNKLLEFASLKNPKREFNNFRNKYIDFSDLIYNSPEELINNPPEADCYIAGSDQVWHPAFFEHKGEPFFLNFGAKDAKRISYAPSFSATTLDSKRVEFLRKRLKKFSAISVREDSGIDICRKSGFHAEKVVDPTILVNPSIFNHLIRPVGYRDYSYLYILNIEKSCDIHWETISVFLTKIHLKPIVTVGSGYQIFQEWFNNVIYEYATIPLWLSLINNTSLFFTTSFHGVVFALLNHTKFIFIPLKNSDGPNSRLTSLLSPLGLSNRIWDGSAEALDRIYNNNIDWDKVDRIMDKQRNESAKWLIKSINN